MWHEGLPETLRTESGKVYTIVCKRKEHIRLEKPTRYLPYGDIVRLAIELYSRGYHYTRN